jgi:hypothetical protein
MKTKKKRQTVKYESALDKMLAHHLPTCTWHIYSGDRRCSCGRDAALVELTRLRATLPLFAMPAQVAP